MICTIRPYSDADFSGVSSLLECALSPDVLTPDTFVRKVLLDQNFEPDGALVAEIDSKIAGFAWCVRRLTPLENAADDSDRAYLPLIAVLPEYRRNGVGSKLLKSVESFASAHGCNQMLVSPYAPNYFIPGVDRAAYPEALAFFESCGYQPKYRPLSMQTSLWSLTSPEWVGEKKAQLIADGVCFGRVEARLARPVLEFCRTEFPGDWVRVAREAMTQSLLHNTPSRLDAAWIEAESGPKVLAFSHFEGERFGPIGVAASERGRGLGQVLTAITLGRQRDLGYRAAWFLWSDDRTAARLYDGFGFREVRRFVVFGKSLEESP